MDEEFKRLDRPGVPAMDAILSQPFRVLDDGFVRVIDCMGSDDSIVQAARVSYGVGTKRVHEDRGLLLDLHNLHPNSVNFDFDPIAYLDNLDRERIGAVHLAGGKWMARCTWILSGTAASSLRHADGLESCY